MKSRLKITQGHWKRNHWVDHTRLTVLLVELFDVKYYRDLELCVRGHSRLLKIIPFESLGTVSYRQAIIAFHSDRQTHTHRQTDRHRMTAKDCAAKMLHAAASH